jgi:processive 1,2-diacylglycerol beta-glucosyltransferase
MAARAGVLVVSASAGTGHLRAAEALQSSLASSDSDLRVDHIDILDLAPSWVHSAYGGGFELMATHAPWLWRELYERTDGPSGSEARWGNLARRILFREFGRLLSSAEWRFVLCTHFLPAQLAAGRVGLPPFGVVVTDFTVHRYWVQSGVDRYFVATEDLATELRSRARGALVEATGIPIAPRFGAAPSRAEARAEVGLDPSRPVALVVGGGMGLGIEETVRSVLSAGVPSLQVVAVCGRNEAARARLAGLGIPADELRVHGYLSGIERYLAAADLVVTKPGGLTTSEALALGCPLLLTRPIPGQEEGNVRTLTAAGAALSAPDAESLRRALGWAFGEPGVLAALGASARRIGRPDAAARVTESVRREYLAPVPVPA